MIGWLGRQMRRGPVAVGALLADTALCGAMFGWQGALLMWAAGSTLLVWAMP